MIASYSPPKLEYAKLDSPSSKASPDLLSRSGLFLRAEVHLRGFYGRGFTGRLYIQPPLCGNYMWCLWPKLLSAWALRGLRGFGLSKIGA